MKKKYSLNISHTYWTNFCLLPVLCFMMIQSCGGRCKKSNIELNQKTISFGSPVQNDQVLVFSSSTDSLVLDTLIVSNKSDRSIQDPDCDKSFTQQVDYFLISPKMDTLHVVLNSGPNVDHIDIRGNFKDLVVAGGTHLNNSSGEIQNSFTDTTVELLPEYSVNGTVYTNVLKVTHEYFFGINESESPSYYFAENIGPIEFSAFNEDGSQIVQYQKVK